MRPPHSVCHVYSVCHMRVHPVSRSPLSACHSLTSLTRSLQGRQRCNYLVEGVEPADHKVSRRRFPDCSGARDYLVEGTVVHRLPYRIQIHSQWPIAGRSSAARPIDPVGKYLSTTDTLPWVFCEANRSVQARPIDLVLIRLSKNTFDHKIQRLFLSFVAPDNTFEW